MRTQMRSAGDKTGCWQLRNFLQFPSSLTEELEGVFRITFGRESVWRSADINSTVICQTLL